MSDIVERINNRIHDAPMPTEHLLDEAAEEIDRLRGLLRHYANWIEDIYGQLPTDKAPGPPRMLLQKMREDAAPPRSP
jgi:hypothetical protein